MKLKLIEAGGITGRKRVAEKDISAKPATLKRQVKTLFSKKDKVLKDNKNARDTLQYFLEFNGVSLPLNSVTTNKQLESIITELKSELKYT